MGSQHESAAVDKQWASVGAPPPPLPAVATWDQLRVELDRLPSLTLPVVFVHVTCLRCRNETGVAKTIGVAEFNGDWGWTPFRRDSRPSSWNHGRRGYRPGQLQTSGAIDCPCQWCHKTRFRAQVEKLDALARRAGRLEWAEERSWPLPRPFRGWRGVFAI